MNTTSKSTLLQNLKHWPIVFVVAAIGLFAVGCKLFSGTVAPTPVEQTLYNIQTNYVTIPVTVLVTNLETNAVSQVVIVTNTANQVVTQTNIVQEPVFVTTPQTNYVQQPGYSFTPNANASTATGAVAVIGNGIVPGVGTLAGAGLTALIGIWGWLRSSKTGTQQASAANSLSQEIETMLEFINTLPNGTAYTTAITSWLQTHQVQAGTANTILTILQNEVSNPEAKAAVASIQAALAAVQTPVVAPVSAAKPAVPPPAAPPV